MPLPPPAWHPPARARKRGRAGVRGRNHATYVRTRAGSQFFAGCTDIRTRPLFNHHFPDRPSSLDAFPDAATYHPAVSVRHIPECSGETSEEGKRDRVWIGGF